MFLCIHPVDMRKSFDGLTGIVQEEFRQDPVNGHLFLFVNKRRDRMKESFRDDDGFIICYKRLKAGTWQLPIVSASLTAAATTLELEAHELAMILRGIDLKSARRRTRYEQLIVV